MIRYNQNNKKKIKIIVIIKTLINNKNKIVTYKILIKPS